MAVKKGKHSKVEGPFKSFVMGCGGFGLLVGGYSVYDGNMAGLAIIGGSIAALWLGSKIPDKNRVEW